MSTDPVEPRQNYPEEQYKIKSSGSPAAGGRSGGAAIAIGAIMLVAGIALSMGSSRVFIGLIVVGIINIVRGLASN